MPNTDYVCVKVPLGYPGKVYHGDCCYEHHLVWWLNTGEIAGEGEVIHHKDGDRKNNTFENLEKITLKKHVSEHVTARGRAVVVLTCPSCGIVFERDKRNTHLSKGGKETFCSRRCIGKKIGRYRPAESNVQKLEVIRRIGR